MPRASVAAVDELFESDLDDATLQSWLEIAATHVDDIAAADASVSSARLEQIETLLAAHLASAQDQRLESGERQSASVTYQGETGMGIQGTKYGQQAAALDPTGTLQAMDKPTASIGVPNAKGLK